VHRDGRDVMVSLYHYMKSFREDFADLSFSDFLRMDNELDGEPTMSRPAYWAHHVATWLSQPNLISIAYESLETDYEATVRNLADFLNIKLNNTLQAIDLHQPKQVQPIANRILKKMGLQREKVSSAVAPRKGKSGDWRTHFNDNDLEYFMSEAGEMMRQLGYIE
jgi:Sulfotransferase domain